MPLLIVFSLAAVGLTTWAFISGYRSAGPGPSATRTKCSVCGAPELVVDDQYCSTACRDRLAKSMDDWSDQFDQHFPDDD